MSLVIGKTLISLQKINWNLTCEKINFERRKIAISSVSKLTGHYSLSRRKTVTQTFYMKRKTIQFKLCWLDARFLFIYSLNNVFPLLSLSFEGCLNLFSSDSQQLDTSAFKHVWHRFAHILSENCRNYCRTHTDR